MIRFLNGPYWGVTNWGHNLRLRAQTGLGWEKVGGISLYVYDVA